MSRPTAAWMLSTPPWARNTLWRMAQAVPSLDLRFADNKSLIDSVTGQSLVTFSRASSATFIDSTGTLATAATNSPRFQHDPNTLQSLGLLIEESRTNLLLNSATLGTQSVTVTATAHTLSFYGTGTVTLTGASTAGPTTGSGAFPKRTTLTFTPTAGSLTLTVSGTVSNAQLEAGAFATSYIPTTAAAATRGADLASVTGSSFSSWFRQIEGTIYATASPSVSGVLWDIGAGGTFGTTIYGNWTGTQWALSPNSAPINVASSVITTASAAVACAIKSNDMVIAANGLIGAVDAACTMPSSPTVLIIGKGGWTSAASYLNGTIGRLAFFPSRLPGSTLQRLTQ